MGSRQPDVAVKLSPRLWPSPTATRIVTASHLTARCRHCVPQHSSPPLSTVLTPPGFSTNFPTAGTPRTGRAARNPLHDRGFASTLRDRWAEPSKLVMRVRFPSSAPHLSLSERFLVLIFECTSIYLACSPVPLFTLLRRIIRLQLRVPLHIAGHFFLPNFLPKGP
jgi:hypothetical protein